MEKEYVYGTWEVYTEGNDVLDKVLIGTYTGYVDEIALSLADKTNYMLEFKKIEDTDKYKPIADEVTIRFDDNAKINEYAHNKYIYEMKKLFKDRPVDIEENGVGSMFKIVADEKLKKEIIKNRALAKLSEEEKEVLGLLERLKVQ